MLNASVNEELVAAANVKEGDVVLEIGPGTGSLTNVLVNAGATVLAIEKVGFWRSSIIFYPILFSVFHLCTECFQFVLWLVLIFLSMIEFCVPRFMIDFILLPRFHFSAQNFVNFFSCMHVLLSVDCASEVLVLAPNSFDNSSNASQFSFRKKLL